MGHKITCFGLSVSLLFLSLACQDNKRTEVEEPKEISIIYSNWSEGIAASFLVKNILEDELDYSVSLKLATIDSAYKKLAAGEFDLMLDAWLPETHQTYWQEYSPKIKDAGVIFEDPSLGLAVSEEAEISGIHQLNTYSDTIYGIYSGAGIMRKTKEALAAYKLVLSVVPQDEAKMLQVLDSLYKRQEPVVITAWKPHLIFSRYELKFLEDPKGIFPGSEKIHALASSQAADKHPAVMKFLERFQLTPEQFSSLIEQVKTHPEGEDAGAKKWMKENSIVVSKWIRNLQGVEAKPM